MNIGKHFLLHWLPVQAHIHFKILVLAFKVIHGLVPLVTDYCQS